MGGGWGGGGFNYHEHFEYSSQLKGDVRVYSWNLNKMETVDLKSKKITSERITFCQICRDTGGRLFFTLQAYDQLTIQTLLILSQFLFRANIIFGFTGFLKYSILNVFEKQNSDLYSESCFLENLKVQMLA
jgi:hypothetical protein